MDHTNRPIAHKILRQGSSFSGNIPVVSKLKLVQFLTIHIIFDAYFPLNVKRSLLVDEKFTCFSSI
ncbi:hypothetical protein C6499_01880 [Candidatus Poribacteria bacterium]|nr:MAG: hypothetical protein C6499_01880 [Candidatus Poribacteria bacterium]